MMIAKHRYRFWTNLLFYVSFVSASPDFRVYLQPKMCRLPSKTYYLDGSRNTCSVDASPAAFWGPSCVAGKRNSEGDRKAIG
jgi:hypothetical protein